MKITRREAIVVAAGATICGASGLLLPPGMTIKTYAAEPSGGADKPEWKRHQPSRLFVECRAGGRSLVPAANGALLNAFCGLGIDEGGYRTPLYPDKPRAVVGPIRAELKHQLMDSGSGRGEDLLAARLRLTNQSDRSQEVCCGFISHALPDDDHTLQKVYLPLAASGLLAHGSLRSLGYDQLRDPEQAVGGGAFLAHYLEPLRSDPAVRQSRAMLLAPVIDLFAEGRPWRVTLFGRSDVPRRFEAFPPEKNDPCGWSLRRVLTLHPGETVEEECFLLVHRGEADAAWKVFHRFAHTEDQRPVGWLKPARVHYYDFLSAAEADGRRGKGYDADVPLFREYRVGLATQHGYEPSWGDYIQPDRKTWRAMQADKHGPAEMSLETIKRRIAAARGQGAKAGIYIHLNGMDDSAPCFKELRDAVLVDETGQQVRSPWQGPDTPGKAWAMSIAATEWREHLLRQARWIMELLDPDAIVVDETFTGLGYDEHKDRRGCLSTHAIPWFRELRRLVRSFGEDRAVLTSDCSLSSFVLWADGEGGDHAYDSLLGHPLYRKTPVRYMAALGEKPWWPCAWDFQRMWNEQIDLARKTGAGVGVSNGWIQFTGLARLPEEAARKIRADIATLP